MPEFALFRQTLSQDRGDVVFDNQRDKHVPMSDVGIEQFETFKERQFQCLFQVRPV